MLSSESVFCVFDDRGLLRLGLCLGSSQWVMVTEIHSAGIGNGHFVRLIQPMTILDRGSKWIVLHRHGIQFRAELLGLDGLRVLHVIQ